MLRDFFGNIPGVTKNLLILNLIVFLYIVLGPSAGYGFERNFDLGLYYFGSPYFKPYQIVSHMFAHGGIGHLLFNMLSLVMFGAVLERIWGPKRFLIFYLVTGLGSMLLHELVNGIQVYNELGSFFPSNELLATASDNVLAAYVVPAVGASGAIFGLIVGFAVLFPNTELMMLFFPIPIKAKYLVSLFWLNLHWE
jgi:membrane associated rhomboid family serine protease